MTAQADLGPAPAQAILASAEHLCRDLSDGSAGRLASRLADLSDRLVAELIPSLDAEAAIVHPYLDDELRVALCADHRQVRALTELLQSVVDFAERRRPGGRQTEAVLRALREIAATLATLVAHQLSAVRQLEEILPASGRERLAVELEEAATAAREKTMLVVSAIVPPTASVVFRRRYDLEAAHALSLAAIHRSTRIGGHE